VTWLRIVPLLPLLLLALSPRPASAQLSDYRLGPGDKLQVTVFGHPDLSVQAVIGGAGSIAMPLVGQVKALQLTVPELQDAIAQALDRDYVRNPRVVIDVLNYRPFFILGEVKNPGKYDYVLGMDARQAVAVAGGYSKRAKEDPFILIRENRDGVAETLRASEDTPIYPGDTIRVQRRLF